MRTVLRQGAEAQRVLAEAEISARLGLLARYAAALKTPGKTLFDSLEFVPVCFLT
jgi:hypothetical protein